MLTVKEILDNATSSLRPVSLTGYPHTLRESLQLYTDYCCGGGEVVTPLPVEPLIWFDFTDAATIDSYAGAVGLITDKISNYQATQNATPARPLLVAEGVQFDGVDDYLSVAIVVNNPWTVIVVMDRDSTAEDITLSNASLDYLFFLFSTSLKSRNLGSMIFSTTDSVTRKTISMRANSISTAQRYNGVDTAGTAFNNSSLRIKDIARHPHDSYGYYLSATIKHIVIFDKFLNDAELADVEGFLNA